MRGGGFHNSGRGSGRGGLTRVNDKGNFQQSTPNNENDRGASNRNRFPPSSNVPKRDNARGRGGSTWTSFQSKANSDNRQNVDASSMDSWDPLRDDFKNNKFSDRDTKRGGFSDPSVHVSQIPIEIDEDGLRNLFVDKLPHFKPTRVSVLPGKDGRPFKIGFVHYMTLDQCEEAIRVMHGHRLGNSHLRVFLGKKSLNTKPADHFKNFRQGDNRNRGSEAWSPRRGSDTHSPNRGSESHASPNRFKDRGPAHSRDTAANGNRGAAAFSSRTDVVNGNQGPNSGTSVETSVCAKCGKNASNACSACNGLIYYCGSTCQMADWPQHQLVCLGNVGSRPEKQAATNIPQDKAVKNAEPEPARKPVKVLKMSSLPKITIPDSCKCLWASGNSPLDFQVQLTDNKEIIENITETMYSLCPGEPVDPDFKPQPGDVVSALYSDENWYRAEVLESGEDRIKVRMFDYGTEDLVSSRDVRPLNHLLHVMPQAVPCRLHDLLVPNEHTEVVMNFFATCLQESGAELRLSKVDEEDGVFKVRLTLTSGEDLGDLLVANGHASRLSGPKENPYRTIDTAEGIDLNKIYPINVSYITNFDEIYVSFLSNCELLKDITDSLHSLVAENPGGNFVVNDAVVVQFEGMPGRGLVSALVSNKKYKVKFVDFGNLELFDENELWKISNECLQYPELAVKCRLDIEKTDLTVDPAEVVQYLKTEYPDARETRCKFVRKEGDTYVIQLLDVEGVEDEISRLRSAGYLRSKNSGPPRLTAVSNKRKVVYFTPRSVQLEVGCNLSTAICNIDNPTTIHANFYTPAQEEAGDFLAQVQQGGEGRETFAVSGTAPELDQLVLCFSDQFQEWFRARVTSVGVSSCEVYALDYGITKEVTLDILVPAEEKFNSYPGLAYRVYFQGAEMILAKLRDTVQKELWEPVLNELLIQEPFESTIIKQDGLDVVINPNFDFVGKLKERIKPIVGKRRSGSESASAASTPPPPGLNASSTPPPPGLNASSTPPPLGLNASSTPPPTAQAGPPALTSNNDIARVGVRKSGGPQYVQITTQEWENVLLTIERLKRAVRELGVDV